MDAELLKNLLEVLVCPLTKEKMVLSEDQTYLHTDSKEYPIKDNLIDFQIESNETQHQTTEMFASKWENVNKTRYDQAEARQKNWYLDLYGFESENAFEKYLKSKKIIIDAGAGRGYKAAWFATLAPDSLVLAVELSDAVSEAARRYRLPNLIFVKGDISRLPVRDAIADYISCDQVIMHTSDPRATFDYLSAKLKNNGEFSCYVYRKKALPRELLDDHFRTRSMSMTKDELMEMSSQLVLLGKRLDELNISFECPDIPAMDIKGGNYTVQRFLYWNFVKCFWNAELGEELSTLCNFDWYAPSQAARYTREEYLKWIEENKLEIIHFHEEEACYSGRFKRTI